MFSIRFLSINAALSVLLLASNASAASKLKVYDEMAQLAASASPMKADALARLYSGRTWKWKTGGGFFFAEKNRGWLLPADWKRFAAWSRQGRKWSYGEGSWYTTDGGKLCLNAVWVDKDWRSNVLTCFLHREKDGVIYQKRSVGGKWYVFSHNPARQDDEYRKLVTVDLVSDELARMKTTRR
ncbi:DUF995 domain-containing protein [Shinella sp.]|uniref:DUF995 domain-containing protein n=1 Tax=Shinella sp. TaxID=1870904 RepID=UPI0029B03FA7|nr:DUF995 domain-containing protein [Shinella sp.]MDX3975776.1 DUF995 domain-containing protein [Shinella sp.]